ncbi:3738_t:CDS:1, partial [Acaulospora colombiana]
MPVTSSIAYGPLLRTEPVDGIHCSLHKEHIYVLLCQFDGVNLD